MNLREQKQWLLGQLIEAKTGRPLEPPQPREGVNKIPFWVEDGKRQTKDWNNPAHWGTYAEITALVDKFEHAYVCPCLTEEQTLYDLDDCIDENGAVAPWAKNIIAAAKGCPMERSQGGRGGHIIALTGGPLPAVTTWEGQPGQLEVYPGNRFVFTLEGFPEGELRDVTETVRKYLPTKKPRTSTPVSSSLSPRQIVEAIEGSRDGGKYRYLLTTTEGGEYEGTVYPSQSEADFALFCLLAHYSGGDLAKCQEICKGLPLHRAKWDTGYLLDGLIKAIDSHTGAWFSSKAAAVEGWEILSAAAAFEPRPPTRHVVRGYCTTPGLSCWYGQGGSFKTSILIDMGTCVADGAKWLSIPQGDTGPVGIETERRNVLLLDFDAGRSTTMEKVEASLRAHGLEKASQEGNIGFYFVSMPTPHLDAGSREMIEGIATLMTRLQIGLVIIDCLTTISGGVDLNTAAVSDVLLNLRWLSEETLAHVALIHHQAKSGAEGGPIGHSSINDRVDLTIGVHRPSAESPDVRLRVFKARRKPPGTRWARYQFKAKARSDDLHTARFGGIDAPPKPPGTKTTAVKTRKEYLYGFIGDKALSKTGLAAAARAQWVEDDLGETASEKSWKRSIVDLVKAGRLEQVDVLGKALLRRSIYRVDRTVEVPVGPTHTTLTAGEAVTYLSPEGQKKRVLSLG